MRHRVPMLMILPSWVFNRFKPGMPDAPPKRPNGRMALRSDRMHAVTGRRNSTCAVQTGKRVDVSDLSASSGVSLLG